MNQVLNISIVLYNNSEGQIKKLLGSINSITAEYHAYFIDHSVDNRLSSLINEYDYDYIDSTRDNGGYGKGHNIAMRITQKEDVPYHLVLNPDILFDPGTVEQIIAFMEKNKDIGLLMPKICYPNKKLQHLCKKLPTPLDLFLRRFSFFKEKFLFIKKRVEQYELLYKDYNKMMDVPSLSGCFMFLRTSAIREVGLFDERFFMYLEDVDLTRRIKRAYRTVYYPEVTIFHEYQKGSYRELRLLLLHSISAIKYFNKWGWVFDSERKAFNHSI